MSLRYLSINQMSEITGVDRRTIKKRLAGLDVHSTQGKAQLYDGHMALQQVYTTGSTQGIEKQLQEEELRIERAKREKLEIEIGKLKGELVSIEDVAKEVEREYSFVRAQVRGLSSKLAKPLALINDPHEIKDRIDELVDETLTELTVDVKYEQRVALLEPSRDSSPESEDASTSSESEA